MFFITLIVFQTRFFLFLRASTLFLYYFYRVSTPFFFIFKSVYVVSAASESEFFFTLLYSLVNDTTFCDPGFFLIEFRLLTCFYMEMVTDLKNILSALFLAGFYIQISELFCTLKSCLCCIINI